MRFCYPAMIGTGAIRVQAPENSMTLLKTKKPPAEMARWLFEVPEDGSLDKLFEEGISIFLLAYRLAAT